MEILKRVRQEHKGYMREEGKRGMNWTGNRNGMDGMIRVVVALAAATSEEAS